MTRIKGIFFDVFGTLVQRTQQAFDALFEVINRDYGLENFKRTWHKKFREIYAKRTGNTKFHSLHSIFEEVIKQTLAEYSIKMTSKEARSLINFFFSKVVETPPRPETVEVLKNLKIRDS